MNTNQYVFVFYIVPWIQYRHVTLFLMKALMKPLRINEQISGYKLTNKNQ